MPDPVETNAATHVEIPIELARRWLIYQIRSSYNREMLASMMKCVDPQTKAIVMRVDPGDDEPYNTILVSVESIDKFMSLLRALLPEA